MMRPSASLTPVARPFLTLISFTSAPVMISPPPASTTRASAFTKRHRPADRQCEAGDIGENRREHDAGAGHVLGGDDVHIRGEQRADALVDEMLAHHAEQIVLGVREQLLRLRPAQPVDELLARHRRVVEQRGQQRPHLDTIGMPELAEGLGVLLGKARQRGAGLVEILVDHDRRCRRGTTAACCTGGSI